MVIAGETVLPGRLDAEEFLVYWFVCMGLTIAAILIALRDLRALQRRHLEEHRNLFQATLNQIATDARAKARRTNPPRPPPAQGQ